MSKAYLDTTILTDILLGVPTKKHTAQKAIDSFSHSELPVYAIKEFKQGPLTNFNWFHTKLVQTKSLPDTLAALQALARTPMRYKTATAIQALSDATDSIGKRTLEELQKKYGLKATQKEVLFDETRLAVKSKILRAWAQRRSVATTTVGPLECYPEVDPSIKRDVIDLKPRDCPLRTECCLATEMKKKPNDLKKMRGAIFQKDERRETAKRCKALRKLYRTPKRPADRSDCRDLGDAMFAFFAPADSTILTTNIRDHRPLAEALSKKVQEP